jgi:hypothetical protein
MKFFIIVFVLLSFNANARNIEFIKAVSCHTNEVGYNSFTNNKEQAKVNYELIINSIANNGSLTQDDYNKEVDSYFKRFASANEDTFLQKKYLKGYKSLKSKCDEMFEENYTTTKLNINLDKSNLTSRFKKYHNDEHSNILKGAGVCLAIDEGSQFGSLNMSFITQKYIKKYNLESKVAKYKEDALSEFTLVQGLASVNEERLNDFSEMMKDYAERCEKVDRLMAKKL